MDDIADDALMDCVDKLDARKLKGNQRTKTWDFLIRSPKQWVKQKVA